MDKFKFHLSDDCHLNQFAPPAKNASQTGSIKNDTGTNGSALDN